MDGEHAGTADGLGAVLARIGSAAGEVGRDPGGISLVAVTKMQPEARVRSALEAGHRLFGENRVQEALERWRALKPDFPDAALHLIGPLQTNKVRDAVRMFDVIETVDRPRLALALAREFDRTGRALPCFIQVNTGEEPQKAGILPDGLDAFVAECSGKLGLRVVGLMCIPPLGDPPGPHFAFLREAAERNGLVGLSMGMSADFETAIAFGATHVRVGSAVFGARGG